MARNIEPKCRLCRREGVKLFLKGDRCSSPKCPLEKKGAVPPGQHGHKHLRGHSGYGEQLREKQKVKRIYDIKEKQFQIYINRAKKEKGRSGDLLLQALERRLDNVVYRSGLINSRTTARQLVSHGHVLVNNKKVNIPSYQVKSNEVISLTEKAIKMDLIKKSLEQKIASPDWLKRKAYIVKVERLPKREDIAEDINEQLIIEFYSR